MAEKILIENTDEMLIKCIGVRGEDWEKGDWIGNGGSGAVYLVKSLRDNSEPKYVVKEIHVYKNNEQKNSVESFKNETEILKKIGCHKRIVPFIGASKCDDILSIFMGYMKQGSLRTYSKKKNGLGEEETRRFTKQILEGLEFLHVNKIIHRDVKGDNVLMEDERHIRLTDFGISKILQDVSSTATSVGTERWMAPEVMGLQAGASTYNEKADIWSVGCTVIEMMTGRSPYCDIPKHQVPIQIDKGILPTLGASIVPSKELRDFLQKTLQPLPKDRPAAKDLLQYDIFINCEKLITELKLKLDKKESEIRYFEEQAKYFQDNVHLDILQTKLELLIKENTDSKSSFEKLSMEKDILQTELDRLKKDNFDTRSSFENLSKEKDKLQMQFDILKKENSDTISCFEKLSKEKDILQTEFDRLKKEKLETRSSFETLSNATESNIKDNYQFVKMATESHSSIDILIVGKTGHGKSATGNTILRKEAFKSDPTSTSVTSGAAFDVAIFKDRKIVVVDSPGIGDTWRNKRDDILKFIDSVANALAANPKGYHAIIFVMKFGSRFTKEEVDTVKLFKQIFGDEFITKHCILLYTYGDCFDTDPSIQGREISFDQWLKEQNDINLVPFLNEINYRAILFNNRSKDDNQVTKLIKMIDRLNTGRERYSHEMFQQSQELRERLVKELERPYIDDELMQEIFEVKSHYNSFEIDGENIGCSLTKPTFIRERAKQLPENLHDADRKTGAFSNVISLINDETVNLENQAHELETVCKDSGSELDIGPVDTSQAATPDPSSDFLFSCHFKY